MESTTAPTTDHAVGAEWVADGFDAGEVFGQRLGVVGDLDFRGAAAGASGDLMGAFGIEHQNRRLTNSAKGGPGQKIGAAFRPAEGCQPLCDLTASVSCGATLNRSPTMP